MGVGSVLRSVLALVDGCESTNACGALYGQTGRHFRMGIMDRWTRRNDLLSLTDISIHLGARLVVNKRPWNARRRIEGKQIPHSCPRPVTLSTTADQSGANKIV